MGFRPWVVLLALPLLAACNALADYGSLEKVSCTTEAACLSGGTGAQAKSVSVGRKSSCAILTDNGVMCWGANPGTASGTLTTKPVRVPKLTDIASVGLGGEHGCAVDNEGTVSCWGRNQYGQLGDGTNQPSNEPKTIGGLPSISVVTLGASHTCAHTIPDIEPVKGYCWGQNDNGQLGNNTQQDSNVPVALDFGESKLVRLGPGDGFTCAILKTNNILEVWCWGKNDKGQCGQDPAVMPVVSTPMKIDFGEPNLQFERVYPGIDHACARTTGNKIPYCWGANDHAKLGHGTVGTFAKPLKVVSAGAIDQILAGARHTCLITDDTLLTQCWGANDFGQFGGQPGPDRQIPVAIFKEKREGISMRQAEHGCSVEKGVVECWGANDSGQLGNGKKEAFRALPAIVPLR